MGRLVGFETATSWKFYHLPKALYSGHTDQSSSSDSQEGPSILSCSCTFMYSRVLNEEWIRVAKSRFQMGWVRKTEAKHPKWEGCWYAYVRVDGIEKRRPRTRVLGFCDSLSEKEARARLQTIINRAESQSNALTLALRPDIRSHIHQLDSEIMATANKGAAGELAVSLDLMRRGLSVYRAVCPYAACDLIVMIAGELFRVEVKVAVTKPNGKYARDLGLRAGNYDILAVVSPVDGSIKYSGPSSLKLSA